MKMSLSRRLVLCVVAAVLALVSLTALAIPCDEDCSPQAPTCECICGCYGQNIAMPERHDLAAVKAVLYVVEVDLSQFSLLLGADIFRPPIT